MKVKKFSDNYIYEYDDDNVFSDSAMNPNDYCPKCKKKSVWDGKCENKYCDYGKKDSGFGG